MITSIDHSVIELEKTMKWLNWKVRHWSLGLPFGGGTGEDTEVSIYLEETIWYWMVLEFFAWDCCTRVCEWLSHVKLPKFIRKWERKWDKDDEHPCKYEDYWGDCFDTPWHCWIESPFCQWVWSHKNSGHSQPVWKLPLSEARKQFSNFPNEIDRIDKEIDQFLGYDKEVAEKEEEENSKFEY